jgi:cell division septum initiation protein DivIVA
VPITRYVKENTVKKTRARFSFMDATVDNMQRLFKHNEEKELKIKELEEKLQEVRIDERSILSFKASAGKVRNEMKDEIIDMHTNLHLFQNVVGIVIEKEKQDIDATDSIQHYPRRYSRY